MCHRQLLMLIITQATVENRYCIIKFSLCGFRLCIYATMRSVCGMQASWESRYVASLYAPTP